MFNLIVQALYNLFLQNRWILAGITGNGDGLLQEKHQYCDDHPIQIQRISAMHIDTRVLGQSSQHNLLKVGMNARHGRELMGWKSPVREP
jgi:hypothetical protein